MLKKGLIAIGAVAVIAALALSAMVLFKNETEVYAGEELALSLTKPAFVSLGEADVSERSIENVEDVMYTRKLELLGFQIGTFEVTERTLGNGTQFLFERFTNDSLVPLPIETAVSGLSGAEFEDWNPLVVEHEHHEDFGMDPTVNPFGVVTYDGGEVLQGNVYLSTQLETEYDDGRTSYVRELEKEVRDLELQEDSIEKSFWLFGHQIAESWLLASDEALFDSAEAEDAWIDYALHNQTTQLNWLTSDGPYTKLPFSIEPSTKLGYGRTMGRFEDDIALRWNEENPAVFFETMVLNSRANLLGYFNEFDGTRWPTEYTSTWLKNAYGIKAPYVDTRYNEYVAFYLDRTAQLYDDDIEQEELAVEVYADYLLSRIEAGEIIEAGDSFLIADYFDEDPETAVPHASLNHELGGLKILLTAYRETGGSEYLEAANSVIAGIEQFGQADGGWIRDTGDLWYQARPDGTFSGDDYPQLTLVDLLETQALFEELEMERNAYFDELIDSKLQYLESEGIELIEKVTELM